MKQESPGKRNTVLVETITTENEHIMKMANYIQETWRYNLNTAHYFKN